MTMVQSEWGTWNVLENGEWLYEGTFEQCCDYMCRHYDDMEDSEW